MKAICILLIVAAVALILLPPDLNHDGRINAIDCTMLSHHLDGTGRLNLDQIIRSDINNDFSVNQTDLDLMVDIAMGR